MNKQEIAWEVEQQALQRAEDGWSPRPLEEEAKPRTKQQPRTVRRKRQPEKTYLPNAKHGVGTSTATYLLPFATCSELRGAGQLVTVPIMFSASQPFTKCNTYTIMAFLRKKTKNHKTNLFGNLVLSPQTSLRFFFLPITMYIVHYIYSSSIYYSEHHVNQIMLYISTQKYTWETHIQKLCDERERDGSCWVPFSLLYTGKMGTRIPKCHSFSWYTRLHNPMNLLHLGS